MPKTRRLSKADEAFWSKVAHVDELLAALEEAGEMIVEDLQSFVASFEDNPALMLRANDAVGRASRSIGAVLELVSRRLPVAIEAK